MTISAAPAGKIDRGDQPRAILAGRTDRGKAAIRLAHDDESLGIGPGQCLGEIRDRIDFLEDGSERDAEVAIFATAAGIFRVRNKSAIPIAEARWHEYCKAAPDPIASDVGISLSRRHGAFFHCCRTPVVEYDNGKGPGTIRTIVRHDHQARVGFAREQHHRHRHLVDGLVDIVCKFQPFRRHILSDGRKTKKAISLNNLVRGGQQRFRDGEAERLGGREINHRLVLGRRLHGKVGRLLSLEDAIDLAGGLPVLVAGLIRPVGYQAAFRDEVAGGIDRR